MLRILHLSDPHFRAGDPDDRDRVLRALLLTLRAERDQARPPDVVLVSGDLVEGGLAEGGLAEAYAVVARFFDRLLEAADLPRERLLVVPGNHDVDRRAGRRLQRTLQHLADAEDFFTNPEERALHARKLAAYHDFVDEYFGAGSAGLPGRVLSLPEGAVGVATLCSAWFCQDDEDRERLWLGEATVTQARTALTGAELTVALLHHSPDWLHPLERPLVTGALHDGFDLICHGHLHSHRPPIHKGTPLAERLVLAAGSSHRSAQHPSRAFFIDIDLAGRQGRQRTALVRPLRFVTGAERWEPDANINNLYGPPDAPVPYTLPRRVAAGASSASSSSAASSAIADGQQARRAPRRTPVPGLSGAAGPPGPSDRQERARQRYLGALVARADERPAAVTHPASGAPLRVEGLYVRLPAHTEAGTAPPTPQGGSAWTLGVHELLQRHRQLVLRGEPGAGKTVTAWHLCGQLARHALGMPSEAETYGFPGGKLPLPLWFPVDADAGAGGQPERPMPRGARARPAKEIDLRRVLDAEPGPQPGPQPNPQTDGPGGAALLQGEALLFVDGLDHAPVEYQQAFLAGLGTLLREVPRLRVLLTLRTRSALSLPDFVTATLVPLRLPERTQLVDRWVQTVNAIPVGMTIDGTAAELTTLMRSTATSDRATALSQNPLLLTAMCWVSSTQGLPEQRAELYATCFGALIKNRVRETPEEVADLVDEMARRSEPLQSFRVAQTLNERPDLWQAVRPLLEDPQSCDALRFLAGLQARRSPESGSRLLRSLLSEAGGRSSPGERAQLYGLAAHMLGEMPPYLPDRQVARKVQEDLGRLLDDLNDRLQRTPLPTRIAIAEGLGRAGDPRLPLDLLGHKGEKSLWVELQKGAGQPRLGIMRYPLTCTQLWHFVVTSGYEPGPEPDNRYEGQAPIRALWEQRAQEQPNHPATLVSWEDALGLCRFLTQADWRYRYDLPAESEWERAVRQGHDDRRFYPWGGALEPGYCNTGRRVGRTTPVGVFPAGTAAGGAGCVDLIGNVWEWCQDESDEDPTYLDAMEIGLDPAGPDPGLGLPGGAGQRVARGGSWNYLRAGAMRQAFPGTRSDEVGVRLVRRSK